MNGLIDLFESFKFQGNRPALFYRSVVRRTSHSYAELFTLSCKMASLLAAAGVNPGDRVLIWGPNHPAWVFTFWGIVARGAVAVPVDFMSGSERAESIAALSGAVFAVQSRMKPEPLGGIRSVVMEPSGFRATVQHMGRLVDRGISLLLFPEGERTQDSGLLPFQKGLGVMVQELGIPVVPVAIIGLDRILPRGAIWPKKGAVRVVFGKPVDFSGKSPDEIVRLAEAAVSDLVESA